MPRISRALDSMKVSELIGARDEIRTRDPQLGKLMLYQLSYSRAGADTTAQAIDAQGETGAVGLQILRPGYSSFHRISRLVAI